MVYAVVLWCLYSFGRVARSRKTLEITLHYGDLSLPSQFTIRYATSERIMSHKSPIGNELEL